MTWAAEMTAYVNAHSDHDLTLWRGDFGYPVGTVAWSAWVESLHAMNTGFERLIEDEGYHAMVEKGQEFITAPPQDLLREVMHGAPTGQAPPLGAVGTVTTAVMAGGKYSDAISWSIEMAELVEEVTKMPTGFLVDAYGTFGQVTWISVAPDAATADATAAAINGNDQYLKRLGDVGELFVPASGHRGLVTRIA